MSSRDDSWSSAADTARPETPVASALAPEEPARTFGWLLLVVIALAFGGWTAATSASPWKSGPEELLRCGAASGARLYELEFWRLLTACFVHAGLAHLVVGALALALLGRQVERTVGTEAFLVVALGSGVVATLASCLVAPQAVTAGASGMAAGLAGALTSLLVLHARDLDAARLRHWGLLVGGFVVAAVASGVALPDIANSAHLVGFLAGAWLGWSVRPTALAGRKLGMRRVLRSVLGVGILFALAALVVIALFAGRGLKAESLRQRIPAAHAAQRLEEVVELCGELLTLSARDPVGHQFLVVALWDLERRAEFDAALARGLAVLPEDPYLISWRAQAFYADSDFERAAADHAWLIVREPGNASYQHWLGLDLLPLHRWEEAAQAFDRAVLGAPDECGEAPAWRWLARQLGPDHARADEELRGFLFSPQGAKASAELQRLATIALSPAPESLELGAATDPGHLLKAVRLARTSGPEALQRVLDVASGEGSNGWARAVVAGIRRDLVKPR